ncbi:MAG: aminoacyl-tRNA hydrolase [Endomicrobia bacterium]|nr:aminoacyl-tRNA hydrolase [Endomicrobiia bacterium]MCL2506301.1 aminoacyl-tRNA hydrolase [Endomicrobiia bacterium]
MIKLFVGLGNPGSKYENTRHNLGFMVLDEIAKNKRLEFKTWSDMADISFYDYDGVKIALLKPMTFMNNSGIAVSNFARYYKINADEIFVFYDDFAIPLGEFRVRLSGSAGGHNGISSMISHLNTQNFPRMKLGIGPLPKFIPTADYVLSRFHEEDKEKIETIKQKALLLFDEINKAGLEKAISKIQ